MRRALFLFYCSTLFAKGYFGFEDDKIISSFRGTIIDKASKYLENPKAKKETSYKPNELIVDLKDPIYKDGILTTTKGGVIKGDGIRIQAKKIKYIKQTLDGKFIHKIEAQEDLIIQYKGRIYVGESLEYDFTKKSGIVFDGKTFASPWYLGGDRIELKKDGSFRVHNVYITTCENIDSTWDIHAGKVNVFRKDLLQANRVRFRLFKLPTMWLPSFKINLKKFLQTPIIRYKVTWDKSSGPKGSMRYRLYSWKDFAVWTRLEYRLKKGWGGAVETEYLPSHNRSYFQTKNYLATDTIPNDVGEEKRRYRIQGLYHSENVSKTTKMHISWDKFSDVKMPSDFKSDDFELNTAKKTEASIWHKEDFLINNLYARPRVNSFDTIKQPLPTEFLHLRPYKLNKLNLLFYNYFKTSFLSYEYSDKLSPSLLDFHSSRLETNNRISLPIHNSYFSLTPYAGFVGIYYSRSPDRSSKEQALFQYGASFLTNVYKNYSRHKHIIQPYVEYKGVTRPTERVDSYYIFSIEDGYNKLNMLRPGIKNQVYSLKHIRAYPTFESDLYLRAFLDSNYIKRTIPKAYLDLSWNLPSIRFDLTSAYNFDQKTLDFSNFSVGWTVSEDFAFNIDFRYRSSYDLRKSNHENFILDVSRDIEILKDSPISDKRNTILTSAFFRINPFWTLELHSHHGWNRKNEPPYNSYKIDLFTMISSSWKLRISYQHTPTDDRFSTGISLIK